MQDVPKETNKKVRRKPGSRATFFRYWSPDTRTSSDEESHVHVNPFWQKLHRNVTEESQSESFSDKDRAKRKSKKGKTKPDKPDKPDKPGAPKPKPDDEAKPALGPGEYDPNYKRKPGTIKKTNPKRGKSVPEPEPTLCMGSSPCGDDCDSVCSTDDWKAMSKEYEEMKEENDEKMKAKGIELKPEDFEEPEEEDEPDEDDADELVEDEEKEEERGFGEKPKEKRGSVAGKTDHTKDHSKQKHKEHSKEKDGHNEKDKSRKSKDKTKRGSKEKVANDKKHRSSKNKGSKEKKRNSKDKKSSAKSGRSEEYHEGTSESVKRAVKGESVEYHERTGESVEYHERTGESVEASASYPQTEIETENQASDTEAQQISGEKCIAVAPLNRDIEERQCTENPHARCCIDKNTSVRESGGDCCTQDIRTECEKPDCRAPENKIRCSELDCEESYSSECSPECEGTRGKRRRERKAKSYFECSEARKDRELQRSCSSSSSGKGYESSNSSQASSILGKRGKRRKKWDESSKSKEKEEKSLSESEEGRSKSREKKSRKQTVSSESEEGRSKSRGGNSKKKVSPESRDGRNSSGSRERKSRKETRSPVSGDGTSKSRGRKSRKERSPVSGDGTSKSRERKSRKERSPVSGDGTSKSRARKSRKERSPVSGNGTSKSRERKSRKERSPVSGDGTSKSKGRKSRKEKGLSVSDSSSRSREKKGRKRKGSPESSKSSRSKRERKHKKEKEGKKSKKIKQSKKLSSSRRNKEFPVDSASDFDTTPKHAQPVVAKSEEVAKKRSLVMPIYLPCSRRASSKCKEECKSKCSFMETVENVKRWEQIQSSAVPGSPYYSASYTNSALSADAIELLEEDEHLKKVKTARKAIQDIEERQALKRRKAEEKKIKEEKAAEAAEKKRKKKEVEEETLRKKKAEDQKNKEQAAEAAEKKRKKKEAEEETLRKKKVEDQKNKEKAAEEAKKKSKQKDKGDDYKSHDRSLKGTGGQSGDSSQLDSMDSSLSLECEEGEDTVIRGGTIKKPMVDCSIQKGESYSSCSDSCQEKRMQEARGSCRRTDCPNELLQDIEMEMDVTHIGGCQELTCPPTPCGYPQRVVKKGEGISAKDAENKKKSTCEALESDKPCPGLATPSCTDEESAETVSKSVTSESEESKSEESKSEESKSEESKSEESEKGKKGKSKKDKSKEDKAKELKRIKSREAQRKAKKAKISKEREKSVEIKRIKSEEAQRKAEKAKLSKEERALKKKESKERKASDLELRKKEEKTRRKELAKDRALSKEDKARELRERQDAKEAARLKAAEEKEERLSKQQELKERKKKREAQSKERKKEEKRKAEEMKRKKEKALQKAKERDAREKSKHKMSQIKKTSKDKGKSAEAIISSDRDQDEKAAKEKSKKGGSSSSSSSGKKCGPNCNSKCSSFKWRQIKEQHEKSVMRADIQHDNRKARSIQHDKRNARSRIRKTRASTSPSTGEEEEEKTYSDSESTSLISKSTFPSITSMSFSTSLEEEEKPVKIKPIEAARRYFREWTVFFFTCHRTYPVYSSLVQNEVPSTSERKEEEKHHLTDNPSKHKKIKVLGSKIATAKEVYRTKVESKLSKMSSLFINTNREHMKNNRRSHGNKSLTSTGHSSKDHFKSSTSRWENPNEKNISRESEKDQKKSKERSCKKRSSKMIYKAKKVKSKVGKSCDSESFLNSSQSVEKLDVKNKTIRKQTKHSNIQKRSPSSSLYFNDGQIGTIQQEYSCPYLDYVKEKLKLEKREKAYKEKSMLAQLFKKRSPPISPCISKCSSSCSTEGWKSMKQEKTDESKMKTKKKKWTKKMIKQYAEAMKQEYCNDRRTFKYYNAGKGKIKMYVSGELKPADIADECLVKEKPIKKKHHKRKKKIKYEVEVEEPHSTTRNACRTQCHSSKCSSAGLEKIKQKREEQADIKPPYKKKKPKPIKKPVKEETSKKKSSDDDDDGQTLDKLLSLCMKESHSATDCESECSMKSAKKERKKKGKKVVEENVPPKCLGVEEAKICCGNKKSNCTSSSDTLLYQITASQRSTRCSSSCRSKCSSRNWEEIKRKLEKEADELSNENFHRVKVKKDRKRKEKGTKKKHKEKDAERSIYSYFLGDDTVDSQKKATKELKIKGKTRKSSNLRKVISKCGRSYRKQKKHVKKRFFNMFQDNSKDSWQMNMFRRTGSPFTTRHSSNCSSKRSSLSWELAKYEKQMKQKKSKKSNAKIALAVKEPLKREKQTKKPEKVRKGLQNISQASKTKTTDSGKSYPLRSIRSSISPAGKNRKRKKHFKVRFSSSSLSLGHEKSRRHKVKRLRSGYSLTKDAQNVSVRKSKKVGSDKDLSSLDEKQNTISCKAVKSPLRLKNVKSRGAKRQPKVGKKKNVAIKKKMDSDEELSNEDEEEENIQDDLKPKNKRQKSKVLKIEDICAKFNEKVELDEEPSNEEVESDGEPSSEVEEDNFEAVTEIKSMDDIIDVKPKYEKIKVKKDKKKVIDAKKQKKIKSAKLNEEEEHDEEPGSEVEENNIETVTDIESVDDFIDVKPKYEKIKVIKDKKKNNDAKKQQKIKSAELNEKSESDEEPTSELEEENSITMAESWDDIKLKGKIKKPKVDKKKDTARKPKKIERDQKLKGAPAKDKKKHGGTVTKKHQKLSTCSSKCKSRCAENNYWEKLKKEMEKRADQPILPLQKGHAKEPTRREKTTKKGRPGATEVKTGYQKGHERTKVRESKTKDDNHKKKEDSHEKKKELKESKRKRSSSPFKKEKPKKDHQKEKREQSSKNEKKRSKEKTKESRDQKDYSKKDKVTDKVEKDASEIFSFPVTSDHEERSEEHVKYKKKHSKEKKEKIHKEKKVEHTKHGKKKGLDETKGSGKKLKESKRKDSRHEKEKTGTHKLEEKDHSQKKKVTDKVEKDASKIFSTPISSESEETLEERSPTESKDDENVKGGKSLPSPLSIKPHKPKDDKCPTSCTSKCSSYSWKTLKEQKEIHADRIVDKQAIQMQRASDSQILEEIKYERRMSKELKKKKRKKKSIQKEKVKKDHKNRVKEKSTGVREKRGSRRKSIRKFSRSSISTKTGDSKGKAKKEHQKKGQENVINIKEKGGSRRKSKRDSTKRKSERHHKKKGQKITTDKEKKKDSRSKSKDMLKKRLTKHFPSSVTLESQQSEEHHKKKGQKVTTDKEKKKDSRNKSIDMLKRRLSKHFPSSASLESQQSEEQQKKKGQKITTDKEKKKDSRSKSIDMFKKRLSKHFPSKATLESQQKELIKFTTDLETPASIESFETFEVRDRRKTLEIEEKERKEVEKSAHEKQNKDFEEGIRRRKLEEKAREIQKKKDQIKALEEQLKLEKAARCKCDPFCREKTVPCLSRIAHDMRKSINKKLRLACKCGLICKGEKRICVDRNEIEKYIAQDQKTQVTDVGEPAREEAKKAEEKRLSFADIARKDIEKYELEQKAAAAREEKELEELDRIEYLESKYHEVTEKEEELKQWAERQEKKAIKKAVRAEKKEKKKKEKKLKKEINKKLAKGEPIPEDLMKDICAQLHAERPEIEAPEETLTEPETESDDDQDDDEYYNIPQKPAPEKKKDKGKSVKKVNKGTKAKKTPKDKRFVQGFDEKPEITNTKALYVNEWELDDLSVFVDCQNLKKGERMVDKRDSKDLIVEHFIDIHVPETTTGWFRDCTKRIDYVVAFTASGDDMEVDEFKVVLLSNLVQIGFDVEIERGVLPEHNNILFCKLHASDFVLADYMEHFEVPKHFMDNHISMVGKPLRPHFWDKYGPENEREHVKIVRKRYIQPLKLSNRDRSYIAYMIISHMRFGPMDRHYGLHRLLAKKVLLAAYALHDGPYFLPQKCFLGFNARQILFTTWCGMSNKFTKMPLQMIYEYFGPKIALFFAFYQFYILMLMVMALLSFLMTFLVIPLASAHFNSDSGSIYCKGKTPGGATTFCPACMSFDMCPLRNITDYCMPHLFVKQVKMFLTLSPVLTLWCIAFCFLWRRTQNYYTWLWELRHNPRHPLVSVQYNVPYRYAKRSKRTGLWKWVVTPVQKMIRSFLPLVSIFALFFIVGRTFDAYYYSLKLMKSTSFFMKIINKSRIREYLILAIIVPVQCCVMFLSQWIYEWITPWIVHMENHRFVKNHDRSLIYQMYSYGVLFNMPMIIFSYYLKGRFYEHPLIYWKENKLKEPNLAINTPWPLKDLRRNVTIEYLGDILYYHCNKSVNCLDESLMIFLIVMVMNMLLAIIRNALRFYPRCFSVITDYSEAYFRACEVPEWEREFMLRDFSDYELMKWTNYLVIEMTLFMWFGNVAPYICIPLLIMHLILVRALATQLLTNYRRPILMNCRGLGTFNRIIMFVCFATPFMHAFTNSRKDTYPRHEFNTNNFSLVPAAQKQYEIVMPPEYRAEKCLYPARYTFTPPPPNRDTPFPFRWLNFSYPDLKLLATYHRFYVDLNSIVDIIKYSHFFILLILLLLWYFPSKSSTVKDRSYAEDQITRYSIRERPVVDDKDYSEI